MTFFGLSGCIFCWKGGIGLKWSGRVDYLRAAAQKTKGAGTPHGGNARTWVLFNMVCVPHLPQAQGLELPILQLKLSSLESDSQHMNDHEYRILKLSTLTKPVDETSIKGNHRN